MAEGKSCGLPLKNSELALNLSMDAPLDSVDVSVDDLSIEEVILHVPSLAPGTGCPSWSPT